MYTDDQLITMIQDGGEKREEALKYFFTDIHLEKTVIQKIRSKGGAEQDAWDAYQEGFRIFYRHILSGSFGGRSNLKTYFVGICIRCWLDGLKKSFYKRTTLTDEEPILDEEYRHTPEVELISKERKLTLRKIIALLGERCKQVILLKNEGYGDDEIKETLELPSHKLVRKIRYRCMTKLKEMMANEPALLSLLKSLSYG